MSGKVYKRLNAELSLAMDKFEKGEITAIEMAKILAHVNNEHLEVKRESEVKETDSLLGLLPQ